MASDDTHSAQTVKPHCMPTLASSLRRWAAYTWTAYLKKMDRTWGRAGEGTWQVHGDQLLSFQRLEEPMLVEREVEVNIKSTAKAAITFEQRGGREPGRGSAGGIALRLVRRVNKGEAAPLAVASKRGSESPSFALPSLEAVVRVRARRCPGEGVEIVDFEHDAGVTSSYWSFSETPE